MVRNYTVSFFVLSAFAIGLVGCGSSSTTPTGSSTGATTSPTPTPTVTVTTSPTPTPGSQNVCTSEALAAGDTVYYSGQTGSGTPFTNANQSYIGTVQGIYSNGNAVVTFSALNETLQEPFAVLMPEATCTQSLIGVQVLYIGATSAVFPSTSTIYTGVIDDVFAGANAQVNFGFAGGDVVVPFSDIAVSDTQPTPTPTPTI